MTHTSAGCILPRVKKVRGRRGNGPSASSSSESATKQVRPLTSYSPGGPMGLPLPRVKTIAASFVGVTVRFVAGS